MFIDYRMFYTKTGRLKYISHLDVNRLMQRAIKRSGLPVWYSEGFNPHIYLTFALPLALGVDSRAEVMDFRLTADLPEKEIRRRMQEALPQEIEVLEVAKPVMKPQEIGSARYRIEVQTDDPSAMEQKWKAFLSRPTINIEKRTKKGPKMIDLRPDLTVETTEQGQDVWSVVLRLPAGVEKNISPFLVLEAFAGTEKLPFQVTKLAVLHQDGRSFR